MSFNPILQAQEEFNTNIPHLLPHAQVYKIQVGPRLFKLSGASLSSDGPSYFTDYFSKKGNEEKVLYMDRNSEVFEFISLHLQGYYVAPNDDNIYVYLVADSCFFGLKKLQAVLTKDYDFARVGDMPFRIPKALLNTPGNQPNYFSLNDPLNFETLTLFKAGNYIRPPPLKTINVFNRSPELFKDLLETLRGNTSVIKDDHHRDLLVKECRYYRLLQLEQKLIKHKIIYNPCNGGVEEIIMNIGDIAPKGLAVPKTLPRKEVKLQYQRPFLFKEPRRDLTFQICNDTATSFNDIKLIINKSVKVVVAKFSGQIYYKFKKLFEPFVSDISWASDDSDPLNPSFSYLTSVKECDFVVNGLDMKSRWIEDFLEIEEGQYEFVNTNAAIKAIVESNSSPNGAGTRESPSDEPVQKKRKVSEIPGDIMELSVTKSLWQISFLAQNPKLEAIAIEAFTDPRSFTKQKIDYL